MEILLQKYELDTMATVVSRITVAKDRLELGV
jgi:hypothetical protein